METQVETLENQLVNSKAFENMEPMLAKNEGLDCQRSIILMRREDVPHWLAFNPYVLGFYRSNLTELQCLRTILMVHNETGNIWTHMLPIFFFLSLFVDPGPWPDAPWTFLAATLPSIICLICSSAYHTLMPLPSQKAYVNLLLIDYLSVFNMMIWPTVNLINGSFQCHETQRIGLLCAYLALAAAMLVVALRAKNNVERLIPFALLSAARLILQGMRAWLGQASPEASLYFFMVEVFGISGGLLNATRYPEKMWPGSFDLWFNSHQMMHVLTAVAQLCVWKATDADRTWGLQLVCTPLP